MNRPNKNNPNSHIARASESDITLKIPKRLVQSDTQTSKILRALTLYYSTAHSRNSMVQWNLLLKIAEKVASVRSYILKALDFCYSRAKAARGS